MSQLLTKIVKSVAYASAGGAIVLGTAKVDLVDADLVTTIYMVVAAVLFNAVKEYLKTLSK